VIPRSRDAMRYGIATATALSASRLASLMGRGMTGPSDVCPAKLSGIAESGRTLHQRQRVLGPVEVDPEGGQRVSVIATNLRETADLHVAEDVSVTRSPTGSRPTG